MFEQIRPLMMHKINLHDSIDNQPDKNIRQLMNLRQQINAAQENEYWATEFQYFLKSKNEKAKKKNKSNN